MDMILSCDEPSQQMCTKLIAVSLLMKHRIHALAFQ